MRGILLTVTVSLLVGAWAPSVRCGPPTPAKRYTVNLDLPPEQRWVHVVNDFTQEIPVLLKELEKIVPPEVLDLIAVIGDGVEKYIPYPYNMEMVGVALTAKVSVGEVVLGNTIYEVKAFGHGGNKACTSIVAEAVNGTIYHGRNLDFMFNDVLRNVTIIVDYQQNGTTIYTGTTFAGYVGLLSGQKPNGFTVTLNERDTGDWWMNALEAIIAGTRGIAGFHIRDALADPNSDFESALEYLAYKPLIAPCYLIIGGLSARQGAVITRDRLSALDIWRINAFDGRWFLVETNYDHWNPPPTSDDRRDPAIKAMNQTGRENLSGKSLFNVLSVPPVLNSGTVYTVVMSAAIPELYNTWVRHPSSEN